MQGAQGISELIKEKYITLSCQEHTQSSLGNTLTGVREGNVPHNMTPIGG